MTTPIKASEFAADSFPAVEAGGIEAGAKPASSSGMSSVDRADGAQGLAEGEQAARGAAESVRENLTRSVADSSPDAGSPEEPFGVSQSMTPAGLEIYYQAGPKRLYRVRPTKAQDWLAGDDPNEWVEVPSVTTVLGVLDKSGPLTWWSQGVAADGIAELVRRGLLIVCEGDPQ